MTSDNPILVIPCYNEEQRLPIEEYQGFLSSPSFRILFVDDGSTDRTIELLEGLKSDFPDNTMIHALDSNKGKAEAVREGVNLALKQTSGLVGFADADLATPLKELNRLLEVLQAHDEVNMLIGSRIKLHGSTVIERNWMRHYAGRVFATITSKMLKAPIYDTQCGAKWFRNETAAKLFEKPFNSSWIFDVELIFRLMVTHGRSAINEVLREEALHVWIEKGDSKVSMWYSLKMPFEMLRVKRIYKKQIKD